MIRKVSFVREKRTVVVSPALATKCAISGRWRGWAVRSVSLQDDGRAVLALERQLRTVRHLFTVRDHLSEATVASLRDFARAIARAKRARVRALAAAKVARARLARMLREVGFTSLDIVQGALAGMTSVRDTALVYFAPARMMRAIGATVAVVRSAQTGVEAL